MLRKIFVQCLSVHIVHYEERVAAILLERTELDDVRMRAERYSLGDKMVVPLQSREMPANGSSHGLFDLVARRYAACYGGQNREIDGVVASELIAKENAAFFKKKKTLLLIGPKHPFAKLKNFDC